MELMVYLKSHEEIEKIAGAGQIVVQALRHAREIITAGLTTGEIDREIEKLIDDAGCRPVFKGYRGYPASSCVSINNEVVHLDSIVSLEDEIYSVILACEVDLLWCDSAR